jgi:hypothetical protein
MYDVEFSCPTCVTDFTTDFTVDWTFGDEVECPSCHAVYETDWETNGDDDVQGPWLSTEVSAGVVPVPGPTKDPPART